MRDLIIIAIIYGSVPFILRRPTIGVLMWVWVSVMAPHRLTWGMAYDQPFGWVISIATILGIVFSSEPKRMPVTAVTVVMFMMAIWMSITTMFAINPAGSMPLLTKVLKILFMVFVMLFVFYKKEHVEWMIWVLAGSVAFFGIKGGVFTLLGGGIDRVYGPPGSYIEENNTLALAIIMTIPLLRYLQLQTSRRWLRWGLTGSMALCGVSVLGSQSR